MVTSLFTEESHENFSNFDPMSAFGLERIESRCAVESYHNHQFLSQLTGMGANFPSHVTLDPKKVLSTNSGAFLNFRKTVFQARRGLPYKNGRLGGGGGGLGGVVSVGLPVTSIMG